MLAYLDKLVHEYKGFWFKFPKNRLKKKYSSEHSCCATYVSSDKYAGSRPNWKNRRIAAEHFEILNHLFACVLHYLVTITWSEVLFFFICTFAFVTLIWNGQKTLTKNSLPGFLLHFMQNSCMLRRHWPHECLYQHIMQDLLSAWSLNYFWAQLKLHMAQRLAHFPLHMHTRMYLSLSVCIILCFIMVTNLSIEGFEKNCRH